MVVWLDELLWNASRPPSECDMNQLLSVFRQNLDGDEEFERSFFLSLEEIRRDPMRADDVSMDLMGM